MSLTGRTFIFNDNPDIQSGFKISGPINEVLFTSNEEEFGALNVIYDTENGNEISYAPMYDSDQIVYDSNTWDDPIYKTITFSNEPVEFITQYEDYMEPEDFYTWFEENTTEIIPTYTITIGTITNGTLVADKESAAAGEIITLTNTPATGYELVSYSTSPTVVIQNNSFIMPAKNVTITATFAQSTLKNMNFKQNILPVSNNTYSLGAPNSKWKVYANSINGIAVESLFLPTVTATNNGQVLQVSNGFWAPATIPIMTGATSSAAGTAGLIPAPASADREKFFRGDGTWQDGGKPMVILSYGNSTWNDFINAYNNNVIVYCRASSNSNPKTGSQTRMAFMAYVNDAANPTNVEFQYYRSVNPTQKSASQMSDQVFVYTLTNTNGGTWSVTTRQAGIQSIAAASGSKIGVSYNDSIVTLSNTMTANDMPMSSSDATTAKAAIDTINTKLGSTTMGTTATTVTGAIAEHESDISTLNSKIAKSSDTIVSDISGVKTALSSFASNMNEGDSKLVRITHTNSNDASIMRPHIRYAGYLVKNTNNNFSWLASGYIGKNPVIFSYYSGNNTWVAEKVAVESFVDALNDKIATVVITCPSLADLKNNILSVANGLNDKDSRVITFWVSGATEGFKTGRNYSGVLTIAAKSSNSLYFDVALSAYDGDFVVVGYQNGTWNINPINNNAAKYIEGVAKVTEAVTWSSPNSSALVKIDVSNIIAPSRVKCVLSCGIGVNPAGVTMTVAQNYSGSTGIWGCYIMSSNEQTVAANTDVNVRLLYI